MRLRETIYSSLQKVNLKAAERQMSGYVNAGMSKLTLFISGTIGKFNSKQNDTGTESQSPTYFTVFVPARADTLG
jgi:hypothetical protein